MTGKASIQRVLMTVEGKCFFVRNLAEDYHCNLGAVPKEELTKTTGIVHTNRNKQLTIFTPSFYDVFSSLPQGPQIMNAKDIGFLIASLGLGKQDVVVEAGSGSGKLSCNLAHIVKKVISYEIKKENHELSQKNAVTLDLTNIVFKLADISQGIAEKQVDAVILDMLNPWDVISSALTALKTGGFLVAYTTNITQTMQFVEALDGFALVKTSELIKRDWHVEGRRVRPQSQQLAHTGFITITRKLV